MLAKAMSYLSPVILYEKQRFLLVLFLRVRVYMSSLELASVVGYTTYHDNIVKLSLVSLLTTNVAKQSYTSVYTYDVFGITAFFAALEAGFMCLISNAYVFLVKEQS